MNLPSKNRIEDYLIKYREAGRKITEVEFAMREINGGFPKEEADAFDVMINGIGGGILRLEHMQRVRNEEDEA